MTETNAPPAPPASIMSAVSAPKASVPKAAAPPRPPMAKLPQTGMAVVKAVVSGDTVVLSNTNPNPNGSTPEALFTLSSLSTPRLGLPRSGTVDEPHAWSARMWLASELIGKTVKFECHRSAESRYYGVLYKQPPQGQDKPVNVNLQCVALGHASVKSQKSPSANEEEFIIELEAAQATAKASMLGVWGGAGIVRKQRQAGEQFNVDELVAWAGGRQISVFIEHNFDGTRYRCSVLDEGEFEHASFTLQLAGVQSPRLDADFGTHAKQFVDLRLLNRTLKVTFVGSLPSPSNPVAVCVVHHPRGNIGVELLKTGFAMVSERTARMLGPVDVVAYRQAEGLAKTARSGVWQTYQKPTISGIAEATGTVLEVVSGDTLVILPAGVSYDDEGKLLKVSLASIRSPRLGGGRKPDEPYSYECKDRLRQLCVGKQCKVTVDYEREIPMGPAGPDGTQKKEKRKMATISVGKRACIGEVLVSEGLAAVQRHRDGEERSSNYDTLCGVETAARAAKKNMHSPADPPMRKVNDLSDPKKAKAYAGFLQRSGVLKAQVEYVFGGTTYKLWIPAENCTIRFALSECRSPQPTPNNPTGRAAEPFGDAAKRFAKMHIGQRNVEVVAEGLTNGGVVTGKMFVGAGAKKENFASALLKEGLSSIDWRDVDSTNADLVSNMSAAKASKKNIWSLENAVAEREAPVKKEGGQPEEVKTIRISEIRNGNKFYYHEVGSPSVTKIDEAMKLFKEVNGVSPGPVAFKKNKILAALFSDGKSTDWYRAKVLETSGSSYKVIYIDHGNVGTVTSSQCRNLDNGLEFTPPCAREAELALVRSRELNYDEGIEAARTLSSLAWGKELTARIHAVEEGKMMVTLYDPVSPVSLNEELVKRGLARVISDREAMFFGKNSQEEAVKEIFEKLKETQEGARKERRGIWVYGDVGEDDDERAKY
ncbi:hypothetical protein TrST_g10916 [Triparma strigata]|uniref:TNase-like domain-containing protein n=1 Tax=Triparma strigata TaxID=1606541 RepID=A0A9W7ELI1_9STRA|nr:hypothetical protein TrST_g10916 [Triparma strigata]